MAAAGRHKKIAITDGGRFYSANPAGRLIMSALATHKLPLSSQPRLADAFGNQLASATTGTALWASDAASAGWGHNTKEHDASTGLVYMYQRWYMPETGTFLSTDPLSNAAISGLPAKFVFAFSHGYLTHHYAFGLSSPVRWLDANGGFPHWLGGGAIGCAIGGISSFITSGGNGKSAGCGCLGGAIAGAIGAAFPHMTFSGGCLAGMAANLANRVCDCGLQSFGGGLGGTLVGAIVGCASGGWSTAGGATSRAELEASIGPILASIIGDAGTSIADSIQGCCE